MAFDDVLYSIGTAVERFARNVYRAFFEVLFPSPSPNPPKFKLLGRFVKRNLTVHEFLSLSLQLLLLSYLVLSTVAVWLRSWALLGALFVFEFLGVRYVIQKYREYLIESESYRFFYYGISLLAFLAFAGYMLIREFWPGLYHYYLYLLLVSLAVLAFRWYFKRTFGRDYTYGVVEELKGDLVRVFIHDDISANVKPGFYWLPAVPDAEPGVVVKILVEDRAFRSARPVRIIEVYLSQSSQSSTEPKKATE